MDTYKRAARKLPLVAQGKLRGEAISADMGWTSFEAGEAKSWILYKERLKCMSIDSLSHMSAINTVWYYCDHVTLANFFISSLHLSRPGYLPSRSTLAFSLNRLRCPLWPLVFLPSHHTPSKFQYHLDSTEISSTRVCSLTHSAQFFPINITPTISLCMDRCVVLNLSCTLFVSLQVYGPWMNANILVIWHSESANRYQMHSTPFLI